MDVPKERTALLVIDMQNGFLDEQGSMARIGMPHGALVPALAGCERLVEAARKAGVPVIYTRYVYQPGYADGGLLPTELVPQMVEAQALINGTWDAEIVPSLTPAEGEVVIDKSRPSSFYGTQLEPVLASQAIRSLVLCGVTTPGSATTASTSRVTPARSTTRPGTRWRWGRWASPSAG